MEEPTQNQEQGVEEIISQIPNGTKEAEAQKDLELFLHALGTTERMARAQKAIDELYGAGAEVMEVAPDGPLWKILVKVKDAPAAEREEVLTVPAQDQE